MSVRTFLDTNILIYFYSDDEEKRNISHKYLNNNDCVTSIQAFNEASNVWIKKYNWKIAKVKEHLDNIELVCDNVLFIQRETVNKALDLKERYGYSYYDCLMLASALEGNCGIILTEDMNTGHIIENKLRVVNPFKGEINTIKN